MQFRSERLSRLVLEQLNAIMVREFEFPGAIVTLTDAVLDERREHVTVYVSVYPTEQGPVVLKRLGRAQGLLQRLLLRKLNIRPAPAVIFVFDKGSDNAARVERALLEQHRAGGDAGVSDADVAAGTVAGE